MPLGAAQALLALSISHHYMRPFHVFFFWGGKVGGRFKLGMVVGFKYVFVVSQLRIPGKMIQVD